MFAHLWIFAMLIVAALQDSSQKSYDGWSLIKVRPKTEEQVRYLNSLRDDGIEVKFGNGDVLQWSGGLHKLDGVPEPSAGVWNEGTRTRPFDILIPPETKDRLVTELGNFGIKYDTIWRNIQHAIDAEKVPALHTRANLPNDIWFSKFLTLDEINVSIQHLATANPTLVKIEVIGRTHERRPINLVRIGERSGKKPGIWIDGGMHAREWASHATALYILNKLITGYTSDSQIKSLVDSATWYIVPVLNPDGYAYTHTRDRMWRKNRRPKAGSGCDGVDLNRNFDYNFGGPGGSFNPCQDSYSGHSAFSEPESQAVRNYIMSHKDLEAYITLHSYAQMWFYPFGDKKGSYPSDVDDLATVAQKGAQALAAVYGTRYEVGTAADVLYEAGGCSDDWAKGRAGVKYVYTLELRPSGYSLGNGFLLPPSQITPMAEETWTGLKVVFEAVTANK